MEPYNYSQYYLPQMASFSQMVPMYNDFQSIPEANFYQDKIGVQEEEIAKLKEKIKELESENEKLKCGSCEHKSSQEDQQERKVKKRKRIFISQFICPFEECARYYGSQLSLNLHLKLKHNSGTKKERETYAKIIFEHQEKGLEPPNLECNFPPGFLEQERLQRYKQQKKSINCMQKP